MAQATNRTETGGRGLINLRMSPEDKSVIDRAAKSAGKTRTEFMLDAARQAAHETLLDTTLILTDGTTFSRFKDMFDALPAPPEGLRRLMSLKAPWEP
jgi:uncharacterized protein (DUF1778 family)